MFFGKAWDKSHNKELQKQSWEPTQNQNQNQSHDSDGQKQKTALQSWEGWDHYGNKTDGNDYSYGVREGGSVLFNIVSCMKCHNIVLAPDPRSNQGLVR